MFYFYFFFDFSYKYFVDVNACVEVIIDSEEEDFCVDKPCGQYGTCVSTKTSFICKCDDGWAGTNCEVGLNIEDKYWTKLLIGLYMLMYYSHRNNISKILV